MRAVKLVLCTCESSPHCLFTSPVYSTCKFAKEPLLKNMLSENSKKLNLTAVCCWHPPSFVVFTRKIGEWWQRTLKASCQIWSACGEWARSNRCLSSPPQEAFIKPQTEVPESSGFVYFPNPPHSWSPSFNIVLENIWPRWADAPHI